jgi:hypothetical protein
MPTGTTQAHRPGRLVGVASAGRGRTPERSLVVLRWMAPGSGPLIAVRRLLDRSRPPEPEFERWMRRRKVNGRIRRGDRRRTACPPRPPGSRTAFGVPSRSPSTRRRLRPRSERTRRLRLVDDPRRDRRHPSRPPPHGRWGCSVSASPRRTGSSADLRRRLCGQHIGGNIASSTFRFGLASLLWEREGWRPRLSPSGRPLLAVEDNRSLSDWQRAHLRVGWAVVPEPMEGRGGGDRPDEPADEPRGQRRPPVL